MFSLFFKPLLVIFYAVLAGLALLPSLASALMFQSSSDTAAPAPKGINRTPPPIPVMTPAEFQGKVQSLGEETRKNMIEQGAADIKQQKDMLPQEEAVPPPLPKAPAAGSADIPSGTSAVPASPPPAEASPSPMPETLPAGEAPSAAPAGENSTPDTYTGFSAGSAPASDSGTGGAASSGGNSSGFGLKY